MPADLTVIILAFNEEKHLPRCLESLRGVARRVIVVDCFSTDKTVELARAAGAEVVQHVWINHSVQMNWALDNAAIDTQWTMRLDADEVVTPELAAALARELPRYPDGVMGLTVNRQIHFLGRWIRHGAIYPLRMLRVWRTGHARCENRWMDEHMVVEGGVAHLDADIADINLNSVTWWTDKHNRYASREAVDLLLHENSQAEAATAPRLSMQAGMKRWLKLKVYVRLPMGLRAFLYFLYRYFLRLGFLDGWQGFVFHFLQGWWYRTLVDVKVIEVQRHMRESGDPLEQAIEKVLDIKVSTEA
ncbi:glycosyltransferase family 2 protein [Thioalbus denitrificans]|uniref:Glycosyltransferase involved in cell wall biosynthesis n=1 Tax=Thioalbus denitrificans TaxID=547122 RepID=A0A369CEB7_9GAMM|nr:glycosyltransferase family 2 protein [Thioalbus denitrificans]RCX32249.1 glycosyltransferase involved in cell wall biosynthesis [Thioalbus denitrificans]